MWWQCYAMYCTRTTHTPQPMDILWLRVAWPLLAMATQSKCFSRSSIGGVRLITTKVVVAHTTQWLMEQKKKSNSTTSISPVHYLWQSKMRKKLLFAFVRCVRFLCIYVRVQFRLGADTCECSHIILDFNAMHNAWPECVRQKKSATARFREQLGWTTIESMALRRNTGEQEAQKKNCPSYLCSTTVVAPIPLVSKQARKE